MEKYDLMKGRSLEDISKHIRKQTITIAFKVGPDRKAHPGGSLSLVEILTVLYYKSMFINPNNSKDIFRDRLVLSKGHSCLSLYAILADIGFIKEEDLFTLRRVGSILQGHPDMRKTPGIDMTSGSLGNGLGAGVGMALSGKFKNSNHKVYVILGDGELNEGVIWESAFAAAKYGLDNLIAIVDINGMQGSGSCDEIMPKKDIVKIWEGFGWKTYHVDGHNMQSIEEVLSEVDVEDGIPKVILASTVKGKGVSFMEHNNDWHQRSLSQEEYQQAIREIN